MIGFIVLIFKFAICGIAGVITNFFVSALLKEIFKINKYIANSLGIIFALTLNFFLNRSWTFNAANKLVIDQSFKFILVILFSIILNNFIVYLATEKLNLNFYYSKIIAVSIVFIWNFSMHMNYTFNYNI